MHADKRIRAVIYHEWTLPSPAHVEEVGKAIAAATNHRHEARRNSRRVSDVTISCDDDLVVVGFSVDQELPPVSLPEQRDGGE